MGRNFLQHFVLQIALSVSLFVLTTFAVEPAFALAANSTETTPVPKVGETFRDCANCPEMVVIPAGNFLMGTSQADVDRYLEQIPADTRKKTVFRISPMPDEEPQHRVDIAWPLAIGKYPVTRGEFATFVQETGYRPDGNCPSLRPIPTPEERKKMPYTWWRNPLIEQTDRDPVVCVNLHDAEAYISWLNSKVEKPVSAIGMRPYRLPSEAEFEYAARAGTQTNFWWGDLIGTNNADCDGCGSQWDNKSTAPVGSFRPNPFGLYDMQGNVFEWTADCWNKDYSGAPTDGSAWITGECTARVIRGGEWSADPMVLHSSYRPFPNPLKMRGNGTGFRVARTMQ